MQKARIDDISKLQECGLILTVSTKKVSELNERTLYVGFQMDLDFKTKDAFLWFIFAIEKQW